MWVLTLVWLWSGIFCNGLKEDQSPTLCSVFVHPFGYPCLEFSVRSADGFLVGVQKIPSRKIQRPGESPPAVLLQHGLLQGGDAWFLNPPSQSLGFILADEGFDVWISNGRNTLWSHGHETFLEKDKEFWDWTWDELATYDIPAILEFIRSSTTSQIFYVGHSQGTIIGLAALTSPRVSGMLTAAALLSPITFLNHITSKFIRVAALLYMDSFFKVAGLQEFSLYNKIGVELVDRVCANPQVDCGNFLAAITGPNCCFNASRIPYYLQYEPQSTSLKNMQHLAQMIRKGTFVKFDYGMLGNLRHYLKLRPPEYKLSDIPSSFPVWMAYGGQDCLSDSQDVQLTLGQLGCDPKVLYLDKYAHLDFILSTQARQDLYEDMISFFKAHIRTDVNQM